MFRYIRRWRAIVSVHAAGRFRLVVDVNDGNWLPTLGSLTYSITFRYYGPRGGVTDGTYYPAAIERRR